MSQRNVELFIGRMLTDEDLRQRFARAPQRALSEYCEQGWELTRAEVDALLETDVRFWSLAAATLPSRLRRCCLCPDKKRDGTAS
jgi:hypothetical protein